MATMMAVVGPILSVISTVSQAVAQRSAAKEQRRIADYNRQVAESQAQNLEQQAGQELASSQRAVIEQQRQGRRVQSRALAVAGASGAGAMDPTIINILGDLDFESDFRAGVAGFEGESRARALNYEAVINRATGDSQRAAGFASAFATESASRRSFLTAAGTAFSGGSSLYSRFATTPAPGSINRPPTGSARYGFG